MNWILLLWLSFCLVVRKLNCNLCVEVHILYHINCFCKRALSNLLFARAKNGNHYGNEKAKMIIDHSSLNPFHHLSSNLSLFLLTQRVEATKEQNSFTSFAGCLTHDKCLTYPQEGRVLGRYIFSCYHLFGISLNRFWSEIYH